MNTKKAKELVALLGKVTVFGSSDFCNLGIRGSISLGKPQPKSCKS